MRWFSLEEVVAGLELAAAADAARAARKPEADFIPPGLKPALIGSVPMRLPSPHSIAYHLCKAWVQGEVIL